MAGNGRRIGIFRSYTPSQRPMHAPNCRTAAPVQKQPSLIAMASLSSALRLTTQGEHLADWTVPLEPDSERLVAHLEPEDIMGLLTFSINVTLDGGVDPRDELADDDN